MAIAGQNLPDYQTGEGDYRHVFSYHPMDVEIARAEGIYLFDQEGIVILTRQADPFRQSASQPSTDEESD